MIRIFLPPHQFQGETATIRDSDHLHLTRVMRARPGDPLLLLDGRGNAFHARLVSVEKQESTAHIGSPADMPPEPPVALVVGQALSKGDRLEQVIQHGTEAGASAFAPIRAERSVVDIPASRAAERVARWRQIARGAAEQSGRSRIPVVSEPRTLQELLSASTNGRPAFLLHTEPDALPLRAALSALAAPPEELLLLVGPEGGWSASERRLAEAAGAVVTGLGPRILRTETAALVAISQILYALEI